MMTMTKKELWFRVFYLTLESLASLGSLDTIGKIARARNMADRIAGKYRP